MALKKILQFTLALLFIGFSSCFLWGSTLDQSSTGKLPQLKLSQIVGINVETKEELMLIVDALKDPAKFKEVGAKIPKGILLSGVTGVGKTLIGKSLALEANRPLLYISGSDFIDKYAGGGASRIRELFEKAKKKAPCMIFIDRIEACAKAKDKGVIDDQTLNQLLVELEGISESDRIFVIAATSHPDILDEELLQAGRLDYSLSLHLPKEEGRYDILKMYAERVRLGSSVDLRAIAKRSHGLSGADLEKIINQAAFFALQKGQKEVLQKELELSCDQISKHKALHRSGIATRMIDKAEIHVTFKDVVGIDEAKEELEEIVDFLKDPQKFTSLGARIPKGVLCVGPPGTGKTLMAKAVAGEADCPFFYMSGSEFIEKLAGLGASRMRELFSEAKKYAPCIIFIDEIDAVGAKRSETSEGGHMEGVQTLNQLLVEMDGMQGNDGIILMAATNRVDILDDALLRAGRFDRQVMVHLPDVRGRGAILKLHAAKIKTDSSLDLMEIARKTAGLSGADLANILNEAAILAGRKRQDKVTQQDILAACDKVKFGKERKAMVIDAHEKQATAFHEIGHVMTALILGKGDELEKVSLIPRGGSEGATHMIPKFDQTIYWRKELLKQLVMLMGGRAAEKIFMKDFSSGSASDINRATFLAKSMVCKWGMSKTFGAVAYEANKEEAEKIEIEVKRLIDRAYLEAEDILNKNKDKVELMAKMLVEFETLDRSELMEMMDGKFDIEKKRGEKR